MVQIIKKYTMYLGLDIANIEEEVLEYQFIRKMANFIPYLSVVYLSDVDKRGKGHLPLGEGQIKLELLLKKFKQFEYAGFFSIKLDLPKKTLADIDKVEVLVKKCRVYFVDNFTNAKLD
jgi:sugar phosphate isomerase/epimerase